MSPGSAGGTALGRRPACSSSSAVRASAPGTVVASRGGRTRSSSRDWKSRPAATTTVSTAVEPSASTAAATGVTSSRQTSARAPESASTWPSSRSLYIGLTDTATPPAFHAASMPITNAGWFWL